MLTRNVQGDETTTVPSGWQRIVAVLVGLGLFAVLVYGINGQVGLKGRSAWSQLTARPMFPRAEGQPESPRAAAINNMGKVVGDELMTRFVVPFEVAGLLLTVALVGAIAVAYHERDDVSPQRVARLGSRPGVTGQTEGSGHGQGGREAARSETLSHS
jgi:NADH-quinone oxidoreductase subunit J